MNQYLLLKRAVMEKVAKGAMHSMYETGMRYAKKAVKKGKKAYEKHLTTKPEAAKLGKTESYIRSKKQEMAYKHGEGATKHGIKV